MELNGILKIYIVVSWDNLNYSINVDILTVQYRWPHQSTQSRYSSGTYIRPWYVIFARRKTNIPNQTHTTSFKYKLMNKPISWYVKLYTRLFHPQPVSVRLLSLGYFNVLWWLYDFKKWMLCLKKFFIVIINGFLKFTIYVDNMCCLNRDKLCFWFNVTVNVSLS